MCAHLKMLSYSNFSPEPISGSLWWVSWSPFYEPGLDQHCIKMNIAQHLEKSPWILLINTVMNTPSILFFPFIFISRRLITLQYCSGFVIHWHESAMDLHVFPIPIPPPTSLSARSLWVFPVHQPWALVSCIQPGLVICFTLDNIHVSMLFSLNISPSPSPTESKVCSVHLRLFFCFAYRVIIIIF